MATIQNHKRGKVQNHKKPLILSGENSDYFGESHGYWKYPDPVIPLMNMLSSEAQRNALQKAIDNLGTEDLYCALCEGGEDLSDIPDKIRRKIAKIIQKDKLSDCRFDEVEIAFYSCDFGLGVVVTLYARRRGDLIVYRRVNDSNNQHEWMLDHYLLMEEVPQYIGLDMNYIDEEAIETIPKKLEKKLKDIEDSEAIREGIRSYYIEHYSYYSDFYPLTDYVREKWIDQIEKRVSDEVHCLRDPDFTRGPCINENQLPLPFGKE